MSEPVKRGRDERRHTEPTRSGTRRACPHCEKYARIATSEAQSPLSRMTWFQCTNINCGHTWVEGSMVLHTICPSACPNPNIYIPVRNKEHTE